MTIQLVYAKVVGLKVTFTVALTVFKLYSNIQNYIPDLKFMSSFIFNIIIPKGKDVPDLIT